MEESKKKVYILGGMGPRADAILQFLKNRNWEVDVGLDVMSALSHIMEMKPDFILLDVQLKHPKVRILPAILTQTVDTAVVIPFAEEDTLTTQRMLKNFNLPYTVPAPASGPSVERVLLKIERDRERERLEAERKKNEGEKGSWSDLSQKSDRIAIRGGSKTSDEIAIRGGSKTGDQVHINGFHDGSDASFVHGGIDPSEEDLSEEATPSLPHFYNPQEGQDLPAKQGSILGGAGSLHREGNANDLASETPRDRAKLFQDVEGDQREVESQAPTERSRLQPEEPGEASERAPSIVNKNPRSEEGSRLPDQTENQLSAAGPVTAKAQGEDHLLGVDSNSPNGFTEQEDSLANESNDETLLQKAVRYALEAAADPEVQLANVERKKERSSRLNTIYIKTNLSSGYLVLCSTQLDQIDPLFITKFQAELAEYLNSHGEHLEAEPALEVTTLAVDFIGWSNQYGEFVENTHHAGDQLLLCFFARADNASAELEESMGEEKAQMLKLDLQEIDEATSLDFSVFIYLPRNQKMLRFGKEQRFISQKQLNRLKQNDVSHVLVQKKEAKQVRLYRTRVFLNASILAFLEQSQRERDAEREVELSPVKAS